MFFLSLCLSRLVDIVSVREFSTWYQLTERHTNPCRQSIALANEMEFRAYTWTKRAQACITQKSTIEPEYAMRSNIGACTCMCIWVEESCMYENGVAAFVRSTLWHILCLQVISIKNVETKTETCYFCAWARPSICVYFGVLDTKSYIHTPFVCTRRATECGYGWVCWSNRWRRRRQAEQSQQRRRRRRRRECGRTTATKRKMEN